VLTGSDNGDVRMLYVGQTRPMNLNLRIRIFLIVSNKILKEFVQDYRDEASSACNDREVCSFCGGI
jgi:hypothetical protein